MRLVMGGSGVTLMSNPRHEYGGCSIELCSFETQATPNAPAGWAPHARIWYEDGATITSFPLTGLSLEKRREDADAVILSQARARIDSGNLPRRPAGRRKSPTVPTPHPRPTL